MKMVKQLYLSGFKSFSSLKPIDVQLGRVNVLLGANGAGKSNLISFFRLLVALHARTLQQYVAQMGVQTLLHGGTQFTGGIKASLRCVDAGDESQESLYSVALNFGIPNRLFVAEETVWAKGREHPYMLYSDSNESGLQNYMQTPGAQLVADVMNGTYIYQFNNTAVGAPIRSASGRYDCAALRVDGGNLAAYLLQLKTVDVYQPYYRRIVSMIRSVMPQFHDFSFQPTADGAVWLTWQDISHSGYLMGPHQISDGALRFMALASALLSPPQLMPKVMILDEPELGLHPHAVGKLAGMIKIASVSSQVLVATQSSKLADSFELADVRIVDWNRQMGCTEIRSLDPDDFRIWTEKYNSISDLWEKNLIGGLP